MLASDVLAGRRRSAGHPEHLRRRGLPLAGGNPGPAVDYHPVAGTRRGGPDSERRGPSKGTRLRNRAINAAASIVVMRATDPNGACGVASDAAGVVGWWINPQAPGIDACGQTSSSWSRRWPPTAELPRTWNDTSARAAELDSGPLPGNLEHRNRRRRYFQRVCSRPNRGRCRPGKPQRQVTSSSARAHHQQGGDVVGDLVDPSITSPGSPRRVRRVQGTRRRHGAGAASVWACAALTNTARRRSAERFAQPVPDSAASPFATVGEGRSWSSTPAG